MLTFLRGTGLFVVVLGVVSAQMLPDVQAMNMNELEHLYFDNNGPVGFTSGITPCSNYIDSSTGLNNNTLGRQTAAQWIRTAFRKASFLINSRSSSRVKPRLGSNRRLSSTFSTFHVVAVTDYFVQLSESASS
jgi:hypothetical protein